MGILGKNTRKSLVKSMTWMPESSPYKFLLSICLYLYLVIFLRLQVTMMGDCRFIIAQWASTVRYLCSTSALFYWSVVSYVIQGVYWYFTIFWKYFGISLFIRKYYKLLRFLEFLVTEHCNPLLNTIFFYWLWTEKKSWAPQNIN